MIGQPDLYSSACNQNGPEGANTLCNPQGVAVDKSGNLYVADYNNSRVLKYTPPFLSGHVANQAASVVLGQSTFSTHNNVTSAHGLSNPTGVALDRSGRLYVVDRFNNRVVQFVPPFVTGQSESIVIGQISFTAGACNRSVPANKTTLCSPIGAALDAAGNLYVADEYNSRVLEYNAPLTSGEGAALVFGQFGNFTTTGCNGIPTGLNADSLCSPQGVTLDAAGDLYVADSFADQGHNNRVLKYYTPLKATAHAVATPPRTGYSGKRTISPQTCAISGEQHRAPGAYAIPLGSRSTAWAMCTFRTISTTACSNMTCNRKSRSGD